MAGAAGDDELHRAGAQSHAPCRAKRSLSLRQRQEGEEVLPGLIGVYGAPGPRWWGRPRGSGSYVVEGSATAHLEGGRQMRRISNEASGESFRAIPG